MTRFLFRVAELSLSLLPGLRTNHNTFIYQFAAHSLSTPPVLFHLIPTSCGVCALAETVRNGPDWPHLVHDEHNPSQQPQPSLFGEAGRLLSEHREETVEFERLPARPISEEIVTPFGSCLMLHCTPTTPSPPLASPSLPTICGTTTIGRDFGATRKTPKQ
ncbi:hypothetical protein BLNAU_22590 [Blattamonas nauphoetae]|uniref:Uncharacterized protein n=1 Tax=Blattamonas nauphoetae TaxID=2049346 RepID=A0ABQ9WSK3_9EUKA|nr:hypothetical protein BLNAU_22590 [Blattamonas nauphoetae]